MVAGEILLARRLKRLDRALGSGWEGVKNKTASVILSLSFVILPMFFSLWWDFVFVVERERRKERTGSLETRQRYKREKKIDATKKRLTSWARARTLQNGLE
jgi:hypothetical protein